MSPLREAVLLQMRLRGFSPRTVESYIHAMEELDQYYHHRPLNKLDCSEVQRFLDEIIRVRKLAWATVNVYFSAYRFLYEQVLKRPAYQFSIPRRGRSGTRPGVLSKEEAQRLLQAAAHNVKHQALLAMTYGSGLRVSEVVRLESVDIDRGRMMVRVRAGKGHKDRYTILSKLALTLLEQHWRANRPQSYFFFGRDKFQPMAVGTAQAIYYQALTASGVRRVGGIHVFRQHWADYDRTHAIAPHQLKAVRHILNCRTAVLGGHLHRCESCGTEVPLYNPCLDRHCPTCQTLAKEEWLEDRRAELLPVQYFHTVFTVPHLINPLIDANRALLLGELFAVVNWVYQRFAADPQWRMEGQLGFLALLHTWTQLLQEHFHLHCVIPGGVWRDNQWVACRRNFLFGKQQLCEAFRNRYLHRLSALRRQGKLVFSGGATALADPVQWDAFLRELASKKWVAELRPTAANPEQALDYLGRYVHRVAISDHRILAVDNGHVRFSYRDRADGNVRKEKCLSAKEFIKRFLYHILPDGFVKIRYYGWLSPTKKKAALAAIRQTLHAEPPTPPPSTESAAERILRLTGVDVRRCPNCSKLTLVYVGRLLPSQARGPP